MLTFDILNGWLLLLWRASWQAAWLACAVWLLLAVFHRWLTPNWRIALWSLPLLRFAVLVLPAGTSSVYGWLPPTGELILAAMQSSNAGSSNSDSSESVWKLTDHDSPAESETANVAEGASVQTNAQTGEGWQGLFNQCSPTIVLAAVWGVGFCAASVRWLRLHWQLRGILAVASHSSHTLKQLVQLRRRRLGIRRPVSVLIVAHEVGPATVGLFRPTLLLPQQLVGQLNHIQLLAVVEHELRHVQRWDGLWLTAIQLLRCVYWFHPMVYWIERQLRMCIEQAVDRATLRTLGDANRHSYGELLILLSQPSHFDFGLTAMAGRTSTLKTRIEEITMPTASSPGRSAIAGVLIALLAAGFLLDTKPTRAQEQAPIAQEPNAKPAAPLLENAPEDHPKTLRWNVKFSGEMLGNFGIWVQELGADDSIESSYKSAPSLAADGTGSFTQNAASGKLNAKVGLGRCELTIAPEFDNMQVVSAERDAATDETIMTDVNGRQATLKGATVELSGEPGLQQPTLVFRISPEVAAILERLKQEANEDRARQVGFALLGSMDVDGDSKDDAQQLYARIHAAGGRVDAHLNTQGQYNPELPGISARTTWIVIGNDVDLRGLRAPEASESTAPIDQAANSAAYLAMLDEARANGVAVLSLDKLIKGLERRKRGQEHIW